MSQLKMIDILMIEDNRGDVELTKIAFENVDIPCKIHVAHDGQEGVEYLRKEGEFSNATTPDLILLDINMPRMNGKEVLQIVKNDLELMSIPIIMLTSSDAQSDISDAYQKHANSYIIKPFSIDKFIEVAKRIEEFWGNIAKLPRVS